MPYTFLFPVKVFCYVFTASYLILIGYNYYKPCNSQTEEASMKQEVTSYYQKLPEVVTINPSKRWI